MFFLCISPDETLEQGQNRVAIALCATLWRIKSILFHIRLRGVFFKKLSQEAVLLFIKFASVCQLRRCDFIAFTSVFP